MLYPRAVFPHFWRTTRHSVVASFRHNSESVRFGFRLVRGCVYIALSYYATRRDHKGWGRGQEAFQFIYHRFSILFSPRAKMSVACKKRFFVTAICLFLDESDHGRAAVSTQRHSGFGNSDSQHRRVDAFVSIRSLALNVLLFHRVLSVLIKTCSGKCICSVAKWSRLSSVMAHPLMA